MSSGLDMLIQQLINGIAWGSVYALIALGYTMVYGVLRLINFAHGDLYMVGAYIGYYLLVGGVGFVPALIGAMALCALLGMLIERCAYRPLRHRRAPHLTALITAIGVSLLLENAGQLLFGPEPKAFPQAIPARPLWTSGDIVISNQDALIVAVAILLMLGLRFIVLTTRVGQAMRAVSWDLEAASLMGVPTDRIIAFTFALGSALAAAAGVLIGLRNPKIDPLMGILMGLKAFVAAVLGGIGSIPGAVLGGLLMGVLEYLVIGYWSSTYRNAIAFALLILVLIVRPQGLLGRHLEKV
ncbi:MAG: branched-chain amino acid ABC transporter permease [Armatimonadetes bacterium]|nr:branched-chain amino acid ABC transporter permease [Armatimonadota bacterium]